MTSARVAGLAYLVIIAMGMFAEFGVRANLVIAGDATRTATNIIGSESLFRFSIAADLVMIAFDVIVALILYALLKPVSSSLALLSTLFRLVQASILGANLLGLVAVTVLLNDAEYLTVLSSDQLHSLAMVFIEVHSIGYSIGLVFFGLGTITLGYVLWKSALIPQLLATLMTIAGLIYLGGSLISVLAPDLSGRMEMVYVVPFVAELSFALWLVLRGLMFRIGTSAAKKVPA